MNLGLAPSEALARAGTERIAVVAASLVLGLSASALLPLLLPWRGALELSLGVAAFSAVPFALWRLAWLRAPQQLPLRPTASVLALGCALTSLLALVPIWSLHRGQVRVLNHGDEAFWLLVDGHRLRRVEPSSGESSQAGVELELPSGRRNLLVLAEPSGRQVFRGVALVQGGRPHLFAPASAGYCFQLERREYGAPTVASAAGPPEVEPLAGELPFWVLPDSIAWFTPHPEPGPLQTSGGSLVSLRQKRCGD